jgi:hypothetical protein
MEIKIFGWLLVLGILFSQANSAYGQAVFDRAGYYQVLKEGSLSEIDKELSVLDASSLKEKQAYTATLLMKKAGLLKKPKDKLRIFKQGRTGLEREIGLDSSDAEYHFLRLIIQEHAPAITKYHGQLQEDKENIMKNYKRLLPAVQQAVMDYSKSSKLLHTADLNNSAHG